MTTQVADARREAQSPGSEELTARRDALDAEYGDLPTEELLRATIEREFPGRICLVSSFGAESAILLDMVARIDVALPVIFLDTKKLFGETLKYRDTLVSLLGLKDVRTITPDAADIGAKDPNGLLWARDADACCALRKTRPLARALKDFDAWITGRKQFQTITRAKLRPVECDRTHIKINPLATWSAADIESYMKTRDLPPHPLVADGFLSIGCMPCTRRVAPGEDARAGRWAGIAKTECGIHLGENI